MNPSYPLALHIFRRDLRLQDNTALIAALTASACVIPCFIFDKRQIEHNDYKSDNSIQFMITSLRELDAELKQKQSKLYFFYGIAEDVVKQLIETLPIQAVFANRDYTPFSKMRDHKIEDICRRHKIDFHIYADALLNEPEDVHKENKEPYTVFTPFFRKASTLHVKPVQKKSFDHYYRKKIAFEDKKTLIRLSQLHNPNLFVKGGRLEALSLLTKIKKLSDYEKTRNIPAFSGTTKLSAHNKFGTLSIREVYAAIVKAFGNQHTLITELYWRDFFTHIAFHFPHVFDGPFHKKYAGLTWSNNQQHYRAWCEGRTGFPIVDAGMRELNISGFMHNRVRMIVASFLVKDLHIDWCWGEKYFAQKLIDYDPAVNNGNWQWAASTGCDAQPYFRIFNPWLQQKTYDPECLYIKRFVPELARLSVKAIHALNTTSLPSFTNYPSLLIDHSIESQKTKRMYKKFL